MTMKYRKKEMTSALSLVLELGQRVVRKKWERGGMEERKGRGGEEREQEERGSERQGSGKGWLFDDEER